jgi:hypothetical protein
MDAAAKLWQVRPNDRDVLASLGHRFRETHRGHATRTSRSRRLSIASPPSAASCPSCGRAIFGTTASRSASRAKPNLRLTLRIYALDAGGDVVVRVFEHRSGLIVHLSDPMPVDSVIAEQTCRLAPVGSPDAGYPIDNFPAYAQVEDLPMPSTSLARIDVIPITPGMRIWAFVSATNNVTQQMTVISPH